MTRFGRDGNERLGDDWGEGILVGDDGVGGCGAKQRRWQESESGGGFERGRSVERGRRGGGMVGSWTAGI